MPSSNNGNSGDSTGATRPPSDNKPREEWKLENSSFWWLSLDIFQNPGNILLMSSVPLFMGAYYGYLQPAEKLEEWVGDDPAENNKKSSSQSSSATNRAARRALERETEILGARQMGLQLASRALGLATLGTMGSFGLIGAVGFYLSGCRSIGEAMSTTREWASSRTQSFEDWMGMDDRESKTHPEVVATKNMTEEEEVNYVYDRLMKEIESGSDSDKK